MNQKYSLKFDTKLVSSGYMGIDLEEEKPRSIRFPQKLWELIDADAKKSKRSAVKQMEVVLSLYYGVDDSEVDKEKLEAVRKMNAASQGPTITFEDAIEDNNKKTKGKKK